MISERPIERSEVILRARVIGGIKLLDRGEADDKIIGVLEGDYVWDHVKDISQLAPVLVERLEHYFGTYKMVPGEPNKMKISGKYGYEHAKEVIEASREDYEEKFGERQSGSAKALIQSPAAHVAHQSRGQQRRGRREKPRHRDVLRRQLAPTTSPNNKAGTPATRPCRNGTVGAQHAGPHARDELHQRPGGGDTVVAGRSGQGEHHQQCAGEIDDAADQQCAGAQTPGGRDGIHGFGIQVGSLASGTESGKR